MAQWVSPFEMPCIHTRSTGKHWMEQLSRLVVRRAGNSVTPLRRSSAVQGSWWSDAVFAFGRSSLGPLANRK